MQPRRKPNSSPLRLSYSYPPTVYFTPAPLSRTSRRSISRFDGSFLPAVDRHDCAFAFALARSASGSTGSGKSCGSNVVVLNSINLA